VRLKLTPNSPQRDPTLEDEGLFDDAVEERRVEADEFYYNLTQGYVSDDLRAIMRQALGGMLWTKQYYKFIAKEWLEGDPAHPRPPQSRKFLRSNKVRFSKHCVTIRCQQMFLTCRIGCTSISRTYYPCLTSTSLLLPKQRF
jgi:hypothetical protein